MIKFKSIEYVNFLSTGNTPVHIDLCSDRLSLITGKNGDGKSTMLDALIYCLFGKPFRKVKLGLIINSINGSGLMVDVEFEINGQNYRVVRGMKPSIFEIYKNGEMIPQPATMKDYQQIFENDILDFNYKTFTQIVILGSASFVPFMQLPLASRREIIENLLDINVFSKMNDIIKGRLKNVKYDVDQLKNNLALLENEYIIKTNYYDELNKSNDDKVKLLRAGIEQYHSEIEMHRGVIGVQQKGIDTMKGSIRKEPELREQLAKIMENIALYNNEIKTAQKELSFYENNTKCPRCSQDIDSDFKLSVVSDLNWKVDVSVKALEIAKLTGKRIKSELNSVLEDKQLYNNIITSIASVEQKINMKKRFIQEKSDEIDSLTAGDHDTEKYKLELDMLKVKVSEVQNIYNKKSIALHYYKIVHDILKDDGVKTRIIRQYLPMINKINNKYLGMLDLPINFEFDDNFNESIHSMNRDDFSYHSFSEGEKERIDLALLFTWRDIATRKSRNATNIMIFDEILDGSMDGYGIENFMEIIGVDENVENVFVISHDTTTQNQNFDRNLIFKKRSNFTYLESI